LRLDKFLKVSRIIKRRTIANDACDQGRVQINGKVVKASYDIKVGDMIEVAFGERRFKAEVLDVTEHVGKEGATELYRVIQ
jgi:Ribosome-associated heat shock protein implicated in the recycling of the 50S subunit (S4 paralog)